jgi:2-alkyl-3-oxoalkanoate reductase
MELAPASLAQIRSGKRMSLAVSGRPVVAVTGATGFIGRRLVVALDEAGWQTRLLLRRDPVVTEWRDMQPEVVAGDLNDISALKRLVTGAERVVHLAGLIKAARRAQFIQVNHGGSESLAKVIAKQAPTANLLQISTMAAREPQLSDYAASKRAGEDAVRRILGERTTVLRPPAVYGPGDRETLVFFQLAQLRFVPLVGSPQARAAMIHVDDLISLIVAMLRVPAVGAVCAAADENYSGYSWQQVFTAASVAVGNPGARFFAAPAALLKSVACVGDVVKLAGSANMLNSQKLRELRHADWGVRAEELARPAAWVPQYNLQNGFANAVAWYRKVGWLRPQA